MTVGRGPASVSPATVAPVGVALRRFVKSPSAAPRRLSGFPRRLPRTSRPFGVGGPLSRDLSNAGHLRRLGLEAYGDGQGVEAPLLGVPTVGVVAPALGTPDPIGDAVDQRTELRSQHPIERRMRRQRPVVAVAEVQAPPAPLAQVLLVQIDRVLILLGPGLDVTPGPIGRHPRHLRQQLGVAVHGLGAGGRSGAGQRLGVLGRDVPGGERIGDVRHPRQGLGPTLPPPCLPLRRPGIAPDHLHRVHAAVAEGLQSGHRPSLRGVGPGPHPAQRRHEPPEHPPPSALQGQGAQLRQQGVHQDGHPTQPIGRPDDHNPGTNRPGACRCSQRSGLAGRLPVRDLDPDRPGRLGAAAGVPAEPVRRLRSHAPNCTKGV